MKIEVLESSKLACLSIRGKLQKLIPSAIQTTDEWAVENGYTDTSPRMFFFYDDPAVVPEEQHRADICVVVSEDTQVSGSVEPKSFEGGKYFSLRRDIVKKAEYGEAWNDLFIEFEKQALQMDNKPVIEFYHSFDKVKNVSDVTFLIPIK